MKKQRTITIDMPTGVDMCKLAHKYALEKVDGLESHSSANLTLFHIYENELYKIGNWIIMELQYANKNKYKNP